MWSERPNPLEFGPRELPGREDYDRLRATGAVDLWWADLDDPAGAGPSVWATLAPAERARADRLQDRRNRQRALARRAGLRRLLGGCRVINQAGLELRTGRWGKPRIAPTGAGLGFNLASAGRSAIYALAWGRAVGVDVECAADGGGEAPLARLFASADEQRTLARHAPTSGPTAVVALWTCKEALAKAIGAGLTLPLEELEIGTEAAREAPLLHGSWRRFAAPWRVAPVPATSGRVAALAAEGGWTRIRIRRFGGALP